MVIMFPPEGKYTLDRKGVEAFLKWAGYFDEEIDGNYGSSTTEAVKKYQKSAGLEADGKFSQETIDKTNEYTRNTIMIEPDKKGERE